MRLILLPGMDGTGILFNPLISELPDNVNFNVISYPTHTPLNYSELTALVRRGLPIDDEIIIVAESFSGPIAYNLAKDKHLKIKSIIFVASFLKKPRILLNLINWLPLSVIFKLPIPVVIIRTYFLGKSANQGIVELFKDVVKKVSGKVLASRCKQISNLDTSLESINTPCLYIQAENDKLVTNESLDAFKQVNTSIKVVMVQGPHFILQSNPKKCAEIIAEEYRNRLKD